MDIRKALLVLKLTEKSSLNDLNLSFRKLAKRYHPDFNRGKEKWAHTKMTELNLAYEVALKYFTSPREYDETRETEAWTFFRYFNMVKNVILHGIYIYYQYGLENVHQRREGVRRIRYYDALRYVRKGIHSLEKTQQTLTDSVKLEWCRTLLDFSRAFLQIMVNQRFFQPTSSGYENNSYSHFKNGSEQLDYALKEAFFGDLLLRIRNGSYYKHLSNCYEEFMLVITQYPKSSWVADTVHKIYIIELFTKLIRIFKELRH